MKRLRDDIHISVSVTPTLSAHARFVFRLSPLDLIDGEIRTAIAWDPTKCVAAGVEPLKDLFAGSTRWSSLTEASEAAWQYITQGPKGVKIWDNLDDLFKTYSRRQLGLILFNFDSVRLWASLSDEDDSSNSSSESESEAVEYGPIDAWLEKANLK